ncbi:MAG TPA: PilZ domain-containing protein, partial [Myxococcaceae bacterium]|nr:PilZ domain-containing protein [Myxococcaceae bacterium]
MSVPSRDVLVVHPNAGRRAALASALPSHRVVAVESRMEAANRMADKAPALIIAPPDDARLFLQQVAQAAPDALRVFICSKSDPAGLAELMQSAAEGHVFSILDDTLSGPE